MNQRLTDEQLLYLLRQVDIQAMRIPPGVRRLADLICEKILSEAMPEPIQSGAVPEGWKEAAIAWEVCASIHREYAKKKDPFFTTRQADFIKHAEAARAPAPAPAEVPMLKRLADAIVREVAELPDRDSPADWPAAMLVTSDELRGIVLAHIQRGVPDGDDGKRVLREVFALCEDTETKCSDETGDFARGRRFEAKGIARAIGAWYQEEFCGRAHMGEPAAPAPDHSGDATETVAKPAEVPMPEPAKRTYTNAKNSADVRKGYALSGAVKDEWWDKDQMRTYGEDCRAAGYVAGVKAENARCKQILIAKREHYDALPDRVLAAQCFDHAQILLGGWAYEAALRGEVK